MRRLVIALCLVAVSACSAANQPQATPVSAVTVAATVLPTPVPPPIVTLPLQPTSTAPATGSDMRGSVGQPVENGGVALTVITTTLTGQIDPATRAGAGEAYLIADVLFENTGTDKVAYNVVFFSVLDASGAEYVSSPGAPAPALKSGDLMPGEKVRGSVAFKIKATATGLVMKYQPVTMGRSPRIYIAVP
jgi:hypothetical protein